MQRLAYQGMLTYRSLAFYCRRFAIDVPDEVTGADIGALVAAGKWSQVHDHVRADVAKTTALARRIGVLAREDLATTTGPCDGVTPERTSPMRTDSTVPELAFPKPYPQVLERQARRACQQARERTENATVRQRSGCEVVLGETRCRKRGREIHHLLEGHGRRGRANASQADPPRSDLLRFRFCIAAPHHQGVGRDSVLATHKVHACVDHHRLMGLRWIEVTWTTPDNPMATVRFAQVRGTPEVTGA